MYSDDLLARVAWLYYIEDLTQKEIAQRLSMSRVKVTRLLKRARERGLVEIRITKVPTSHLQIEKSLREELGMADVMVVPTTARDDALRPMLGEMAAAYLSRLLRPDIVVGLGMGRTLAEIARFMQPRQTATCCFVEMVGGIGRGLTFDSYKVSSLLAERCGGVVEHFYAPVIVETPAARKALLSDPQIKAMLKRAASCDLALVSVGSVDLDSFLYLTGYGDERAIHSLQAVGAVGDVLGHFFDIDGQPVPSPIENRLIGLSLSALRRIPRVICVAGGPAKVQAIFGAMRGGYVDVLITDEQTASSLLALSQDGRVGRENHPEDES